MCVLNDYDKAMMNAPSIESYKGGMCAICHVKKATNRHHIVPRSHGGTNGPTIAVCGWGNTSGCHGLLHKGLVHLRYRDGWEILFTKKAQKIDFAVNNDGWQRLKKEGNK